MMNSVSVLVFIILVSVRTELLLAFLSTSSYQKFSHPQHTLHKPFKKGISFSIKVLSALRFNNTFYQPTVLIPSSTGQAESDFQSLRRDINQISHRIDKLEKVISTSQSSKSNSAVNNLLNSFTANTFDINPKNVEICSICAFFVIGAFVGWSLFDKLFILGGLIGGYWASGAVNRDTRGGEIARLVGAQIVQIIIDIQEKYNQFVIFYRTGQLAYMSSKTWGKYDKFFGITNKFDDWKKITKKRAIEFNTAFNEYKISEQIQDFWNILQKAPDEAKRFNEEYEITSTITDFSKGLISLSMDFFSDITNYGKDPSSTSTARRRRNSNGWRIFPWNRRKKSRPVNPWENPFQSLSCYFDKKKQKKLSRRSWMLQSSSNNMKQQQPYRSSPLLSHSNTIFDVENTLKNNPLMSSTQQREEEVVVVEQKRMKNSKYSQSRRSLSEIINSNNVWNTFKIMITTKPLLILKYIIFNQISPVSKYPSSEEALKDWERRSLRDVVREHVRHPLF